MLEAHTANVEAFRRNEGPKLQKELVLPPPSPLLHQAPEHPAPNESR